MAMDHFLVYVTVVTQSVGYVAPNVMNEWWIAKDMEGIDSSLF